MSTLVLPESMVRDRDAGIKANAQHVDDNFIALENAVNGKLDLDGSSVPTSDISMGSNKLTNLGTPTLPGDATSKGYVDSALALKANLASPTFTGTPAAPTVSSATDNSTKIATTAFVREVLEAIYSIGSTYIGTQVNCPMAAFFGTWTLVGTGIVTNVNTSASVAGNGNVLGFTSGANIAYMHSQNESLGSQAGWLRSYVNGGLSTVGDMKVTTNAAASGLQATVTRTQITVNIWRRTA